MLKEDDIVIRMIKWAVGINRAFSVKELVEEFQFSQSDEKWKVIADSIRTKDLFTHSKSNEFLRYGKWDESYYADSLMHVSIEDRFRLIDYLELKEAREGAVAAKKHALWAIVISIASIAVSIGFSIWQITSEPNVNKELLKELKYQTLLLRDGKPPVEPTYPPN